MAKNIVFETQTGNCPREENKKGKKQHWSGRREDGRGKCSTVNGPKRPSHFHPQCCSEALKALEIK